MSELKPCPFCGSEAAEPVFIGNDHTRRRKVTIRCKAPGCTQGVTVGALRFSHEWCHSEAVEKWNTRTVDDELAAAKARIADLESDKEKTSVGHLSALKFLSDRIAELEKALEPFAEEARKGLNFDSICPADLAQVFSITVGDLRHAAALLKRKK